MHVQFELTREDIVAVQLERRAFTAGERVRQLLAVIIPNAVVLVLGWICCQFTPLRAHYLPLVLTFIGCTVLVLWLSERKGRTRQPADWIVKSALKSRSRRP